MTNYGHDVGDQVLRMVASKLNQVTVGGRAIFILLKHNLTN
ncbi:hypothetical protein [Syntrophomonas wolfei]|nr:hypothetical protein [Syntrophomonas wolfei]